MDLIFEFSVSVPWFCFCSLIPNNQYLFGDFFSAFPRSCTVWNDVSPFHRRNKREGAGGISSTTSYMMEVVFPHNDEPREFSQFSFHWDRAMS